MYLLEPLKHPHTLLNPTVRGVHFLIGVPGDFNSWGMSISIPRGLGESVKTFLRIPSLSSQALSFPLMLEQQCSRLRVRYAIRGDELMVLFAGKPKVKHTIHTCYLSIEGTLSGGNLQPFWAYVRSHKGLPYTVYRYGRFGGSG